MRKFLIDEIENMDDLIAQKQATRFEPYRLMYKKSKSYKKLKVYYERTLVDYIEYLYKIACVVTAGKYRIPMVLRKQFLLEEAISLRLLNTDNDLVLLIKEFIEELRKDLVDLRSIAESTKKR